MNEQDKKFDYDFIIELFKGCLTNRDFLEVVVTNTKSNYFPEGILELIYNEIVAQYKVENKKPTVGTLKLALRKNRQALEVIEEVKELDDVDTSQLLFHLENFIKSCRFIEIYNQCAEKFSKGQQSKAYDLFSTGAEEMSKFSLTTEMFESVFNDFSRRQTDRLSKIVTSRIVPTAIDELDRAVQMETGEFCLYLAESKGGKSFLLTHLGISAARFGIGVAHFQIEGTKKACLNRYDAAWSGSLYRDVKNGEFNQKKYATHKRILENLGKTDIHVYASEKFNGISMIDIRKKVIELKKKYDIGLVLIDYLDLVPPDEHYYSPKDERFKQQRTAQLMKELAMEQNVLVVSATQANDIDVELKNDPEFVITRNNLAEDKGKVRPVDYLITLNRTRDEEQDHICRLYIEAAREYRRHKTIMIKQNLSRSRFYDRKRTLEEFFEQEME